LPDENRPKEPPSAMASSSSAADAVPMTASDLASDSDAVIEPSP
jgi:hypothetical protein